MRRYETLGLIVVALLRLSSAFAQDVSGNQVVAVSLEGIVADRDSHPVVDARVVIRIPLSEQVLADTETDVDGKFMLVDLALEPGTYALRASHPGYQSVEKDLKIDASTRQVEPFSFVLGVPSKVRGGTPSQFTILRVFYATDRQEVASASQGASYLNVRSSDGKLRLGSCQVSIPEHHQRAEIERPSFWKLEFHADPDKHVVVQKIHPETTDAFFKNVADTTAASEEKDAFVFIHGYDVSFEDAARRTAQLAYDLGFKGAPIFYSWPSKASLFGYSEDEKNVQLTVKKLKIFLREVAERSGAKTIHLVAHSMGNRAALPALLQLESDPTFKSATQFRHIVLAAPDVDRDVFIQLAKEIKQASNRVTLYVSSKDQALLVSHKLFHTQPRAGEAGDKTIVLPGIDTIDVSLVSTDILGHSYYGDSSSVVTDLLHIFKDQAAPRAGLSKVSLHSLLYWLLQPSDSMHP